MTMTTTGSMTSTEPMTAATVSLINTVSMTATVSMTTTVSTITTVSMTTTVPKATEPLEPTDLHRFLVPISLVIVLSLLIIVACISFLILYKRRQSTSLSNLTKPHKESEENSYASSEHNREFSSKQSDSPDPGYNVIKMGNLKSAQLDNNSKFKLSTKDRSFSDIHSGEYHNYLSDDNHSNNSSNETKVETDEAELCNKTNEPHTYSVVHYKVRDRQRKKENKVIQDANEAPQKHSYGSCDEAPSIPPHTVEMMYTAVQKRLKDSVEIEDEGDAPPIPPYAEEECHISDLAL